MPSLQKLNQQSQDLQRLQALASQPAQGVSRADLAHLDHNGDGKLGSAELTQAGFQDARLRSELQQRFAQGKAHPELPLFGASELHQRSQDLAQTRQAEGLMAEIRLEGKVESFARVVFNQFDTNRDGGLNVAEVNQIDRRALLRQAQDFGLDAGEMTRVMTELKRLATVRSGEARAEGRPPAEAPVLAPSRERDFASGMRYLGDPDGDALAASAQQAPALQRQLARTGSPELQQLASSLKARKGLNGEALLALKRLQAQPDGVGARLGLALNAYLQAKPVSGAAIAPAEKLRYVQDLLRDLAFPEDISQGEKGTCGATGLQIELARRQPETYLKTALSLAQGQTVELPPTAQGTARSLRPNTTFRGDAADDRSLSARLIQNSLMDLGHQAGENNTHYVNARGQAVYFDSRMSVDSAQGLDANAVLRSEAHKYPALRHLPLPTLERLGDGVSEGEIEHVGQAFFGPSWRDVARDPAQRGELLLHLDRALDQGRKVTVGSEDHVMTVLGREQEGGRPHYRVSSWSGQYSMTPEALKARLTNVFLD
ncbi:MAG: hypothetical protein ACO1RX_07325 [Candidatus Sericytochromatia bacterium]